MVNNRILEMSIAASSVSNKKIKCSNYLQKRYLMSIMLSLCLFNTIVNRINISVAIVSMTDKASSNDNFEEFNWTEKEKGVVLGAVYWGAVVTQLCAGQLAEWYSPKMLMIIANVLPAIMAALSPTATHYGGWLLLTALRVTIGLCQGIIPPLCFKLASKWYPPKEMDTLLGVHFTGASFGTVLILPLSGLIAFSRLGWPFIFYLSAAFSLVWTLAWIWLGADTPALHKTISAEERNYIETSQKDCTNNAQKLNIPWWKIFKSPPFYALLMIELAAGCSFAIILSEIPNYVNSILKVDIHTNGMLNAVPHAISFLFVFPTCWLAGYLQNNNILSKGAVRKIWSSIALPLSMALLLPIAFYGTQIVPFTIVFAVIVTLQSFSYSGFLINAMDLSPNFSGAIFGIVHSAQFLGEAFTPIIVGMIVVNTENMNQWWIAFLLIFCLALIGNIVFLLFGSAEIQKWNY